LPHFDSPSVFAAILDEEKGGRFKIAPVSEGVTRKQLYWPDNPPVRIERIILRAI
jgi:GH15 family glucan-1,4-alpha-glucosidase